MEKRAGETYTPDRWVVITSPQGDKVLGGWWGGYLDSDHWRMNSGIARVDDDGDAYLFHGYSGSVYRCLKTRYGVTGMSSHVLAKLLEHPEVRIHPDYEPLGKL